MTCISLQTWMSVIWISTTASAQPSVPTFLAASDVSVEMRVTDPLRLTVLAPVLEEGSFTVMEPASWTTVGTAPAW